jgi:hypothetical protein
MNAISNRVIGQNATAKTAMIANDAIPKIRDMLAVITFIPKIIPLNPLKVKRNYQVE